MRNTIELSLVLLLGLAITDGRCSPFGRRNDEAIATEIKTNMFSEPTLKSANLNVEVKNGVVTLSGGVPDETARSSRPSPAHGSSSSG
jgi:osmotically-inducible protein OsmY